MEEVKTQHNTKSTSLVTSKVASFPNAQRSSNTPLFKWKMNTKNNKRMWYANCLSNQVKSEFYHSLIYLSIHNLDDLTFLQDNMALPFQLGKETNVEHIRVGFIIIIGHRGFPSHWEHTNIISTDIAFWKISGKQNIFSPMKCNSRFPKKVGVHLHYLVWIMEPYYTFIVVSLIVLQDCHFPLRSAHFPQTVNLKSLFHR